jgi:hypothetical protein
MRGVNSECDAMQNFISSTEYVFSVNDRWVSENACEGEDVHI